MLPKSMAIRAAVRLLESGEVFTASDILARTGREDIRHSDATVILDNKCDDFVRPCAPVGGVRYWRRR